MTRWSWSAERGWLTGITAGPSGDNTAVADFGSDWDLQGNLLRRTDAKTAVSEAFRYDALDRLTWYRVNSRTPKTLAYGAIGNIRCVGGRKECMKVTKWLKIAVCMIAMIIPIEVHGNENNEVVRGITVGAAKMLEDGSIELMLRIEIGDDGVGDAMMVVRPEDARYHNVVRHIGGIKPGEDKFFPPWEWKMGDDLIP